MYREYEMRKENTSENAHLNLAPQELTINTHSYFETQCCFSTLR